jgi:hypothetical protein
VKRTADWMKKKLGTLFFRWGHFLQWDHEGILSPAKLCAYGEALTTFGSPTKTVVGFLDCTIRQTCHPGMDESLTYTRYKKLHGMKFQGVVVLNGLLAHLEGPFRAPQNDVGVLNESELLVNMARYVIQLGSRASDLPGGRHFQLYGNSAYSISPHLLSHWHTDSAGEGMEYTDGWCVDIGGARVRPSPPGLAVSALLLEAPGVVECLWAVVPCWCFAHQCACMSCAKPDHAVV